MNVAIINPVMETIIFSVLIGVAFVCAIRRKKDTEALSLATTNELKGWAIMSIVLAHIGFFLTTSNRFLYPLSNFAGIGVDLFLFLSGFGLTVSMLRHPLSRAQFYFRRLTKIFFPLWVVLAGFILLDALVWQRLYSWSVILKSAIGFFPSADLFYDINSPFWYITLILFYYVCFPIFFYKKSPALSALLIFIISSILLRLPLPVVNRVFDLYRLHDVAFPLGMIVAGFVGNKKITRLAATFSAWGNLLHWYGWVVRALAWCILGGVVIFVSFYVPLTTVRVAEAMSVLGMGAVVLMAIVSPYRNSLCEFWGIFSYEIYMLHWPLVQRYDWWYQMLPAGVATLVYVAYITALSAFFKKYVQEKLLDPLSARLIKK